MQTADADGEAGKEGGEGGNRADDPYIQLLVDDGRHDADKGDKQSPVPIFGSAGPIAEIHIFAEAR